MSNFKILTPYISNFSISSASGFDSSLTAGYGARRDRLSCTSATTAAYIQINLSTATAVDTLYIANLDLSCRLIDPTDLVVTVKGSSDVAFGTSEDLTFNVGLADLVGRNSRDYITALTFTTSYQYYRVQISGASNKWACGKIWLGSAIDLGSPYIQMKVDRAKRQEGDQEELREFRIKFFGITATAQNSYYEKIEKYKTFSDLILWDSDNSVFTNSETVIYGKLISNRKEIRAAQFYDLELSVREAY